MVVLINLFAGWTICGWYVAYYLASGPVKGADGLRARGRIRLHLPWYKGLHGRDANAATPDLLTSFGASTDALQGALLRKRE